MQKMTFEQTCEKWSDERITLEAEQEQRLDRNMLAHVRKKKEADVSEAEWVRGQ